MDDTVRRRRALALLTTGVLVTALAFGFGHRGVHAVRGLVVPGAGLYDHRHLLLGIGLTVAGVVSTVAWMRWGMDWTVAVVLVVSMALSAALAYDDHPTVGLQANAMAHEFPLVVLVMGALSWVRIAWRRTPIGRRRASRARPTVAPVDRARAAAVAALAGSVVEYDGAALSTRCRRVGVAARARVGGDPPLMRKVSPTVLLPASALLGVPASEPGWVRLLDGTLAALALHRCGDADAGERWSASLQGPFALRRGHRPSAFWTPLAVRGPRGATWEHAAATGLARSAGWLVTDDDWQAVRTRTLAAAARGSAVADDERLVAAGRIWLCFVDDPQAARVIGRVTIHRDPIAIALDRFATSLGPVSPTSAPSDPPDDTEAREPLIHPTRSTA